MAFDFKNGSGNSGQGGFSAPFGSGSQPKPSGGTSSGSGFGFGNPPQSTSSSTPKSGSGFALSNNKKNPQSGNGFNNLPVQTPTRRPPAPRPKGFDFSGFDTSQIPWTAIIYFLLICVAVGLVIYFWDVLMYIAYNIISILLLIAILLLVIRVLLRRRR